MVVGDFPALGGKVVVSNQTFFCVHPYMDVSENSGFSPQIIHFNRVFHYKPYVEDSQFDYIIFFKWVETANQLRFPKGSPPLGRL